MQREAPPRRPQCAICDGTNETTRLCDACRADPANEGWCEGEPAESSADVEAVAGDLRLGDLASRRLRPDSDRKRAILGLVHSGKIRVAVRNRGRNRRRQPWVWRTQPLSLAEIAFLVGCSPDLVAKVLRKALA
jgi:hypothetical protein